jgi:hypothetical protein
MPCWKSFGGNPPDVAEAGAGAISFHMYAFGLEGYIPPPCMASAGSAPTPATPYGGYIGGRIGVAYGL